MGDTSAVAPKLLNLPSSFVSRYLEVPVELGTYYSQESFCSHRLSRSEKLGLFNFHKHPE